MDERKEFEEWLRDYDPDASTTRADDVYIGGARHRALHATYASVQMLWDAWKARAALAAPAAATVPADERGAFERAATAPPFELSIERLPATAAWPGAYRNYETQIAWEFWQQRAALAAAKGESNG